MHLCACMCMCVCRFSIHISWHLEKKSGVVKEAKQRYNKCCRLMKYLPSRFHEAGDSSSLCFKSAAAECVYLTLTKATPSSQNPCLNHPAKKNNCLVFYTA